jgi:hypothetical protein
VKRVPKYWICDDCVKRKHPDWASGYPYGGNTVTLGLCGHCRTKVQKWLTPVCDYKKPGKNLSWD